MTAAKLLLGGAFICQMLAAILALLLNRRYRQRSAWTLISAAAFVMAIRPLASLLIIWDTDVTEVTQGYLWTESLATLLTSILFLAGIALIEPMFKDLARADDILRREKSDLEKSVAATAHEMQTARAIQQSLLPHNSPQIPGLRIAGSSEPAEWTSGDYFDYFVLADGSLVTVVGDVSGHGTGPALLMTETRAYVRALSQSHGDVGEILTLTNRALANDVVYGQFVTMFAARIDAATRSMTYASAGQDAYLLHSNGEREPLCSTSPPLGVIGSIQIPTSAPRPLHPGDLLLLITDGLNETRNASLEQWGLDRALAAVRETREQSPEQIVRELFRRAAAFRGDKPQEDDNTAVVIKIE